MQKGMLRIRQKEAKNKTNRMRRMKQKDCEKGDKK
jgi:hypothetical protein